MRVSIAAPLKRVPDIVETPRAGAVGAFFVTPHAVRRYRDRFVPGLRYEAARDELIRLTTAGTYVERYRGLHAMGGQLELWRGPRIGPKGKQDRRSRLRFVVGRGGLGVLPQVITVLGGTERRRGR
jgi:hypothetical protein